MFYLYSITSTTRSRTTAIDHLLADGEIGIRKSTCKICPCWAQVHWCWVTLPVPTWKSGQSAQPTRTKPCFAPSEIKQNRESCCREGIFILWVRWDAASTCCALWISGGASLSSGDRQTNLEQPLSSPWSTKQPWRLFQAFPKSRATLCLLLKYKRLKNNIIMITNQQYLVLESMTD